MLVYTLSWWGDCTDLYILFVVKIKWSSLATISSVQHKADTLNQKGNLRDWVFVLRILDYLDLELANISLFCFLFLFLKAFYFIQEWISFSLFFKSWKHVNRVQSPTQQGLSIPSKKLAGHQPPPPRAPWRILISRGDSHIRVRGVQPQIS